MPRKKNKKSQKNLTILPGTNEWEEKVIHSK